MKEEKYILDVANTCARGALEVLQLPKNLKKERQTNIVELKHLIKEEFDELMSACDNDEGLDRIIYETKDLLACAGMFLYQLEEVKKCVS